MDIDITKFKEQGYAIVRSLLPKNKVENVRAEFHKLFIIQLSRLDLPIAGMKDEHSLHQDMQTLFNADLQAYLATARHASKLMSLQALTSCNEIATLVGELGMQQPTIPTTPVLHIMSDKLRVPGGYYGVATHQDWPSIQGGLDTITMWLPFAPVTKETFPLQLIPKSHTSAIWDGTIGEHALEVSPDLYTDDDFISVTGEPGDVAIFTGFVVHRTGMIANGQDCHGLRIASSTRYENSAEPTFAERGFPCAYKRSVERELYIKNFPSPDHVNTATAAIPEHRVSNKRKTG